jgi:acetyltransferase-like isoleucine patch superfamily enzyme
MLDPTSHSHISAAGCTLGIGVVVHYGVTMGEGAVLASDSFLMKGEEVPAHAHWGGNPAYGQPLGERSV